MKIIMNISKDFLVFDDIWSIFVFCFAGKQTEDIFSNFAPVIFICGTLGIDKFIEVCLKTKEKINVV